MRGSFLSSGLPSARSAWGHAVLHDPIPWFWSDQFGVNLQIQGVVCDSDQVVIREMAGTFGNIREIHFLTCVQAGSAAKPVQI
ncbi:MAG: oxidoreductase C-terminal domain-containing protein [Pseudomonadota bacterium]